MFDIKSLGRHIMYTREAQKLTREQVAELCSISSKSLFRIEYGEAIPRINTLVAICDTLKIDTGKLSEFYSREGEGKDVLPIHMPKTKIAR